MKNKTGNENELLGGRLPLLKKEQLNAEQKALYQQVSTKQIPWADKNNFKASLKDGSLIGPFNFHLRNPALSTQYLGWVNAESTGSRLSARIREIIILTIGFSWGADYEAYAHTAVGKAAGQLSNDHRVDEQTYQTALALFTEQGVVDMVHLIGAYLATSAFLNAFEVPAPNTIINPAPMDE